jgi:hypothetical protein
MPTMSMSASGGKADIPDTPHQCLLMTQSGHSKRRPGLSLQGIFGDHTARGTDGPAIGKHHSCTREHTVANDAALDFTGTFEDGGQPCVAPIAFNSTFSSVTVAAMKLHGLIGDTHRHFGGE